MPNNSMEKIEVRGLRVTVGGKEVLDGIDLSITTGEVHALMGPNGSGKSTLAHLLMGDPTYKVIEGSVDLIKNNNRSDILSLSPDERASLGIFLSFQNPVAIPGVSVFNLLRMGALKNKNNSKTKKDNGHAPVSVLAFYNQLKKTATSLGIDEEFLKRSINDGFSGGERKKMEVLQMLVLQPKFALLDELDTGLDVDALKIIAKGIRQIAKSGSGVMLITHYTRILEYVKPDVVHIIKQGKLIKSGSYSVAKEIEKHGYDPLTTVS
ncbi:MAG: hypothetical protein UW73_C0011G0040 [Microgenomates group bacterium GW2011_GWB1_44_8]|nr:MAG: hypothetical protein UW73_C0011G0040 [Microgenomates group bacterium GW2011_GWB1_44_8]